LKMPLLRFLPTITFLVWARYLNLASAFVTDLTFQ
jgi:hypothetical protein